MKHNPLFLVAKQIVQRFVEHGYEACFAGGCVRDDILGLSVKDIDIATSATPDEIKKLFDKTIPVGEKFGVMIVVQGNYHFEVATFRQDLSYKDGRHPEGVMFVTPQEDAQRRDFTINGLFYDPLDDCIIDYVGGQADLAQGVIKAIGQASERFEEDKLRMLRAVRFSARFQFPLDPETRDAIVQTSHEIHQVSMERIRDELCKMLTGPNRGQAIDLLHQTGLLIEVLPAIAAMDGVKQPPEFHPEGDVFVHTKLMLDKLPEDPSVALAFGALLHDVGKPPTYTVTDRIRFNKHDKIGAEMANDICQRLRMSNEDRKLIVQYVSEHMRFGAAMQMREGKLKKMLQRSTIREELTMLKADCEASHNDLEIYQFCMDKLKSYSEEELRPPLLVTGKQLLAWGYQPAPVFSEIIEAVEVLQLEAQIQTLEEAKAHVAQHFPRD